MVKIVDVANVETNSVRAVSRHALRKVMIIPGTRSVLNAEARTARRASASWSGGALAICFAVACSTACSRMYSTARNAATITRVLIASNKRIPASLPTTYSKRGTGLARMV